MIALRYQFSPGSRDLKRLIGITRSPMYSHMTSSIHGLKVIRSYHAELICGEQFFRYLEDNTRVAFLINTLNRWAAMRFDWLSILFITLVTGFAIIARITQQKFSAADIALTLTLSVNLMGLLVGRNNVERKNVERKNVEREMSKEKDRIYNLLNK